MLEINGFHQRDGFDKILGRDAGADSQCFFLFGIIVCDNGIGQRIHAECIPFDVMGTHATATKSQIMNDRPGLFPDVGGYGRGILCVAENTVSKIDNCFARQVAHGFDFPFC